MIRNVAHAETVFSDEQYENTYPDGCENHYWPRARNRVVYRSVIKFLGDKSDSILDIGCGRGINVDFLVQAGLDIYGCDLGSPPPINKKIANRLLLGVDAFKLDLEFRLKIKLILLLDVLEHLETPKEFLDSCCIAFPNCQTFIVTVPARNEIWSVYDEFYGHYRRYDSESLLNLCPEKNFQISEMRYFFHLLYWPAFLMAKANIDRSIKIQAPSKNMRMLHKLLSMYFSAESQLIPGRFRGTSMLGVFTRSGLN